MDHGPFLIGLDLGTSAVKLCLFNLAGHLVRRVRRTYPLHTPHPGWVEQEPEDWWVATCDALHEMLASVDARSVQAVGLSGQAPSQVLVRSDGEALGRAILWSDRRAVAEADWLRQQITPDLALSWMGGVFIPHATQLPARLLWLKAHRADDWANCAAVVEPKDFVGLRLTGQLGTDVNSVSGVIDCRTGDYAADLLDLLGVDKMPPVLEPTTVLGRVTPGAGSYTGLWPGTPVVVGTVDAWCEIIGSGGSTPGCAVDVTGTSEVLAVVTTSPAQGEGVISAPLAEGRHWIGGPMQVGGAALVWLARFFYEQDSPDYEMLEAEAAATRPGAEGLLFLPYLQGERAPVWDAMARAALVGLTDRHTRAHCARAVYEGVAFAVRDLLERCRAAADVHPQALRVSGGASASAFWNQIKADVTGLPVQRMAVRDAGCLGAALLAAVGVGFYGGLDEATGAMTRVGDRFDPVPDRVSMYDELWGGWGLLYPALSPVFSRLGRVVA